LVHNGHQALQAGLHLLSQKLWNNIQDAEVQNINTLLQGALSGWNT
jgi:hypothetical protein